MELALKAALRSAGVEQFERHDLCKLAALAESAGLSLDDPHANALIVYLDSQYNEDLVSGAKYVARYGNGSGGAIPPHDRLSAIVSGLCQQAEERNRVLLNPALPADGSERAR